MKNIQWFPGHMAKAVRMLEDSLKAADGVIYVLDCRCPVSSFNPKLKELAGSKPVVYVLNKCDLADGRSDRLLTAFKAAGEAVKLNAALSSSRRDIMGAIENAVAKKRESYALKGVNKVFRFLVVGVPNTGKSTVINLIAGGKRAVTGDKAGVTRGKQWIRLENFELLDSPGIMPPVFGNRLFAIRLACVGAINDDILDMDDIALALLTELSGKYPERLEEKYGITGGTPLEMLEKLCERRGFVRKGGVCDYERGERALIDDFRKGRLGRITLDSPEDLEEIDLR